MQNEYEIRNNLKKARMSSGLSGQEAAEALGKGGNSYISKIENGPTELNLKTLNALCDLYKVDLGTVLSLNPDRQELKRKPGFFDNLTYRKEGKDLSSETKKVLSKKLPLLRKVGRLQRLLGKSELDLKHSNLLSSEKQARKEGKEFANQVRAVLGSGLYIPAALDQLIWNELSIPVIGLEFDENVSGLYSKDKDGNSLIVYSTNDPDRRSLFTIVHELGHYFRGLCKIDSDQEVGSKDFEEPFANAFAQEFLVPDYRLRKALNDYEDTKDFKPTDIVKLANQFNVSFRMITVILHYGYGIIKKENYNHLKNFNFNDLENLGHSLGYSEKIDAIKGMQLEQILLNLITDCRKKGLIGIWESEEIAGDLYPSIKNVING